MNHSPFEEWLLDDMPMTPEQQRELNLHLRECTYCSALADTGKMLSSARMVSPMPGFAGRFQVRLAERKVVDRKRRFLGTILFLLGGLALLTWISGPWVESFITSPATWVSSLVGLLVFLGTTLLALADAGFVILSVIPKFLPPFVWMVMLSAFAGIALLWSISIWRFVRVPQGVK
jgi:hypothetical protein